jgi:hypothetical protein
MLFNMAKRVAQLRGTSLVIVKSKLMYKLCLWRLFNATFLEFG